MGAKGTLALIGLATLTVATTSALAAEGGPTRDEYAAQVDPICEQNTIANERILKGAQAKVNNGKMKAAGGQFIRASEKFGATVKEIAKVPRPPADDARLVKWFGFLKIVAKNLRMVGKALKEEDRIKAIHERIRVERSSNAANNVSFVFGFRYCRITPSRFT
jgi:hypothetical protein